MRAISDSVIIIDKPPGLTSHEVTTLVKKITGASRSGHAGTLDPEVSGVLPVALGRATKLLQYIAAKDKTYVGLMKFRVPQSREAVESLFKKFTGELVQTPPKVSAVRKVPRKRTVYSLRLIELDGGQALFETRVDAGTYIRTLCEDMGKVCGGARMTELRRTAVGKIPESSAHSMQELVDAVWFFKERKQDSMLDAFLKPPEEFIDLPRVRIKGSALDSVFSGAQIMAPALEGADDTIVAGKRVAIMCGTQFVGIGFAQADAAGLAALGKGIAVKLERVHAARPAKPR